MRRIVIALGCMLSLSFANAQTEKGTLLLGGNATYTNVENTSTFMLSPKIGVFVADNLAIGGQGSLFTSDGFTSWSVGPFARYYFGKNMKGKPFVGANVGISDMENADSEFGFGAEAGYALFLNKSVALEFGVNYNRMDDIDVIGVGVGFQIHFKK